jgi:3-phenylpropionate/trans-cinnamate dioxygenase ferredoxin subunit
MLVAGIMRSGIGAPTRGRRSVSGGSKGTNLPSKPYEYVYGRDDEIIQCPWHGWEFEIATGRTHFNPHKMRVKTYEVSVEQTDEDVTLETFDVTGEDGVVILHA